MVSETHKKINLQNIYFYRFFLLIFLFSFIFCEFSYPQDSIVTRKTNPECVYRYSLNFEHSPFFDHLFDTKNPDFKGKKYGGAHFKIFLNKNDSSPYSMIYRHPHEGIGLHSAIWDRHSFGYLGAIYYFFEIPFIKNYQAKNYFAYSLGGGIGYVHKPEQIFNYSDSRLMSSKLNVYFEAKLVYRYNISNGLDAGLNLGFKHFSNAAFKMPNIGMNFLTFGAEIGYKPTPDYNSKNTYLKPEKYKPHSEFFLGAGIGGRKLKNSGANIIKTVLTAEWLYAVSYKYKIAIGGEFGNTYNDIPVDSTKNRGFHSSYSAVAGWNWIVNRKVQVPLRMGYYFQNQPELGEVKRFYEKVGVSYCVTDNLLISCIIKAHRHVADCLLLTVGWNFK